MIPFLLPSIFLIAEQATNDEYVKYVLPRLKTIFKLQKPLQVTPRFVSTFVLKKQSYSENQQKKKIILITLRNMSLILSKTPPTDIKEHILPMVCRALESDTLEIQDLCLTSLPSFASLLDAQSIKHLVIPRIRKICLESPSVSVRIFDIKIIYLQFSDINLGQK
mgnify:CR=1 FL=1